VEQSALEAVKINSLILRLNITHAHILLFNTIYISCDNYKYILFYILIYIYYSIYIILYISILCHITLHYIILYFIIIYIHIYIYTHTYVYIYIYIYIYMRNAYTIALCYILYTRISRISVVLPRTAGSALWEVVTSLQRCAGAVTGDLVAKTKKP